jgi:hypothetical protein
MTQKSGDPEDLADDLLWSVEDIAEAIGRSRRQTFHMLQNGRLPARKIGAHWCASRSGLRRHFAELLSGNAA